MEKSIGRVHNISQRASGALANSYVVEHIVHLQNYSLI